MARRVKIKLQDTVPPRVISLDPAATEGAALGTNLFMPDGAIGTPETVRDWLGVSITPSKRSPPPTLGANHHRMLQGLPVGDDHPQYTRRDILTANGDIYVRLNDIIARLAAGSETSALHIVGGQPRWMEAGRDYIELVEDFTWPNLSNVGSLHGWLAATTSGSGGTIANSQLAADADAAHPGVLRLTTGTGVSSSVAIMYGTIVAGTTSQPTGFLLGAGRIQIDVLFRFELALPVVTTDEHFIFLGLGSDGQGVPENALALSSAFDGSTYRIIGVSARNGSADVTTAVSSGFAPALNTWYHGRIVVNAAGTSAEFFINGASIGTLTPQAPLTGALNPLLSYARRATAPALGANKTLWVDAYKLRLDFTTPRWT